MIAYQIYQLVHMNGCSFYFNGSIMGMYPIERLFYQNYFDTTTLNFFPMPTKHISIEKTTVFVASTGTIA